MRRKETIALIMLAASTLIGGKAIATNLLSPKVDIPKVDIISYADTDESDSENAKEQALKILASVDLSLDDMSALTMLMPKESVERIADKIAPASKIQFMTTFIEEVPGFASDFISYCEKNQY